MKLLHPPSCLLRRTIKKIGQIYSLAGSRRTPSLTPRQSCARVVTGVHFDCVGRSNRLNWLTNAHFGNQVLLVLMDVQPPTSTTKR